MRHEERVAWMDRQLSLLASGGIWAMTFGTWRRDVAQPKHVTLRPLPGIDPTVDAVTECAYLAGLANEAGWTVTVVPPEETK